MTRNNRKHSTIEELTRLILQQAEEKGFGTAPDEVSVPEKVALIHSEISEAFEAYRHKKMTGKNCFAEELGDAVTRLLHLAGIFHIDIEEEILKKLKSNKSRDWNWDRMNESHT